MSAKALKFKQVTDLTAARTFADILDSTLLTAGAMNANVHFAYLQAETQAVRWTSDGTTPTATVGQVLAAGDTLVVTRGELGTIKLIQAAAGAILDVSPYQNG